MRKLIYIFAILSLPLLVWGKTSSKNKATKNNPETVFSMGVESFMNYEFDEAADLFDEYRTLQEKKKKPLDESLEIFEQQLNIANNAFGRVEKIVIVDSMSLPKREFYKNYNLSPSSGRLMAGSQLANNPGVPSSGFSYVNENGDNIFWTSINNDSIPVVNEAILLLNGEWIVTEYEIPSFKATEIDFPFVCSDGQTFYFSAKGDDSIGGYDLFVAQRDPISGEFRQPLNLGMPYNSPYDDVMLAIDEENGLGWWSTDRNSNEGDLTGYVYIINDVRENYPSDEENLIEYAKISSYKDTQPEDCQNKINDIKRLLTNKLNQETKEERPEFSLQMDGGKTYHKFSDFKNREAAQQMQKLLAKEKELATMEKKLSSMRLKSATSKVVNSQLIDLETTIGHLRDEVLSAKKEVYRLERGEH